MTSDSACWMKFLDESELTADQDTLLQYTEEDDLIRLGIANRSDRLCLIKHAKLVDEKENLPLSRQSKASNGLNEHWLGHSQSTPVHPQSKCNLSPALLSRISFNDHLSDDESTLIDESHLRKQDNESPSRTPIFDNDAKIQKLLDSRQKITSPSSAHGMRTIKSLSDTIALQKKVLVGNDRLKRLTLPRSLIKRQTALISKKVSSLTSRLINPLAKMISKNESKSSQVLPEKKRTEESSECRKMQVPSRNSAMRRSTDLLAHVDGTESRHTVPAVQPLHGKRFKLGAPTTFLTRSLATHVSNE